MCEYCEGISNPISFPMKINNMKKSFNDMTVQFGFMINDNKIKMFIKNNYKEEKEILLEREIDYCPFCRQKIGEKMKWFKNIVKKYKTYKYYKKRAQIWNEFKKTHQDMECGLVKAPKWEYEKDCDNCSYDEEFFEKYGCMYIKDFMDY